MRKSLDAFGYAIVILFMDTLAQRIKSSRKLREMTQKKLADMVGVSTSSISQYESETEMASEPSVKTLGKIAQSLDVSFEWLATGRGKQDIEEFLIDITDMYRDNERFVLLSKEQNELFMYFESMSKDWQEKFVEIARAITETYYDTEPDWENVKDWQKLKEKRTTDASSDGKDTQEVAYEKSKK